MPQRWTNWSGGLTFEPSEIRRPRSEDEVVDTVRAAVASGGAVRAVGSGHSSAPLVQTPGTLLSLEHLAGLRRFDAASGRATLGAGTRLRAASAALLAQGRTMENLGDVDTQALAGAFATASHGTGRGFAHLGDQVTGLRMVCGTGEVVECDGERAPELLRAARASLGLLGVATELTVRTIPVEDYVRREWCVHIEDCLGALARLCDENRNFDFYWYPRREEAKIRTANAASNDPGMTIPGRRLKMAVGPLGEVLTSRRELRFHEMEYAVPFEAGPACFREVRERIKRCHRKNVAWRVLVRTVAADDAYLSPGFGRESMTIAIHQNTTLPYDAFFADIEPIFWRFGGRPHWGKLHTLHGDRLRTLYPEWAAFERIRRRLDPSGVFLNDYLARTFGARDS